MNQQIYYGTCFEDAPKVILARIVGLTDAMITQATLSNLYYLVDRFASKADAVSVTNGTEVIAETSLTISSTIYDTAQTGNGWPAEDVTGFNFKATIPKTAFTTGGQWFRIEVWCDPASGDDFLGGVWILECFGTARD
jgi:hypothetical protein